MRRLGYVPALDGLRGIAIAIVVCHHFFGFPFGGSGVDLFFVLSGFLITTLILEERAETGGVALRGFYARRARRLLPALFAMLATFTAIALAKGLDPLGDLARYGFYTGNLTRAFLVDPHAADSALSHLWSLAEEEQFYLVWPLLLVVLLRARRLLAIAVALTVALILYRVGLALSGASGVRLDYGPDTHLDGLAIGAIVAIVGQRRRLMIPEAWLTWLLVAFALVVALPTTILDWEIAGRLVFELLCAGLIVAAVSGSSFAEALSTRPLVLLGKISYSLYLWHFMIWWALDFQRPLVTLAISVACASASYRFVEQPFRRHRGRAAPAAVPATA